MAYDIHKAEKRAKLPPRVRDPYWREVVRGRAVGFRKVSKDKGYWIARMRREGVSGDEARGSRSYDFEPLGEATSDFDWAQASEAAERWFKDRIEGVKAKGDVVTVSDACRAYVESLRAEKRADTAHDAHRRFERTVYGRRDEETGRLDTPESDLGRVKLAKLSSEHIGKWRNGLKLSKAAANRTLTALKAALYLAISNKDMSATKITELEKATPFKIDKKEKRRNLFLDRKKRRALLAQAKGGIRDLLEGAALTGARAGELVNATVEQFNAQTGEMKFIGKVGTRLVTLPPAARRLFARLVEGKKTGDRIFTRDDGKPWAHSDWDELVRGAAEKAGLPTERGNGVCLYTLRHCFITEALRAHMTTLEVATFVGTSLKMIQEHYGHVTGKETTKRFAKVRFV